MGSRGTSAASAAALCLLLSGEVVWPGEPAAPRSSTGVDARAIGAISLAEAGWRSTTPAAPHGAAPKAVAVALFEDFQGGTVPAGWLVIDNDGLNPDPRVSQFTDGWIVDETPLEEGNLAAMSTSWYSPAGTADDWLVTPGITVEPGMQLFWRAMAPDAGFPDGYTVHVSTTGQSLADCQAGTEVFSTPAEDYDWVLRSVDLTTFEGASICVCFQNNSTDRFMLWIDDVGVYTPVGTDVAITSGDRFSEYGRVPGPPFGYELKFGATVRNMGVTDVTDTRLWGQLYRDGVPFGSERDWWIYFLDPGESWHQALPSTLDLTEPATWSASYSVTIAESDVDPADNVATSPWDVDVTVDELGRDDDVTVNTIGIGDGTSGELGIQFTVDQTALLAAARFRVGPYDPPLHPGDPDIVGNTTVATVWDMVDSRPNAAIATSEVHTFEDHDEHTLTLAFTPPVVLDPGDYVLTVFEEDEHLRLHATANVFTRGTGWVDFPGMPEGPWGNPEDFGFFRTLVLRAIFVIPTLSVTLIGPGTGVVRSDSVWLYCEPDCSVTLPALMSVTLIANPDPGSTFTGWGGDPDCIDGVVVMNGPVSCTATFDDGSGIFADDFEGGDTSAWDSVAGG